MSKNEHAESTLCDIRLVRAMATLGKPGLGPNPAGQTVLRDLLVAIGRERSMAVVHQCLQDGSEARSGDVLTVLRCAVEVFPDLANYLATIQDARADVVLQERDLLQSRTPCLGTLDKLLSLQPHAHPAVLRRGLEWCAGVAEPRLLRTLLHRLTEIVPPYQDALVLARLSAGLNPETLRLLRFRTLKVAVLGDVNTQHLVPLFRAALLYRGIMGDVRAGDFGQIEEILLERSSWMHEFAPNLVLLVSSTLAAQRGDREDFATLVKRRLDFTRNAIDLLSADVVLTTWEPLPEHTEPRGLPDWIRDSNAELRQGLPAQAFLFDLAALVAEVGVDRWFDIRYWGIARQSFHLEHTPLFAARLAAFVRSLLDAPIKLIVTDLDNTLWGGEVAELGPEGIEIGGNGAGLAYTRLQAFLKQRIAEGLVLAACSKNTLEAARRPFLENPEMRLSLSDFAEFRASFMPKTLMIREIAQTLNLGLEQTLFLDDSAHERAEVREHSPEVLVPEWPSDGILGLPAALGRSGVLARPKLTDEDRRRAAMYLEEGQRRESQLLAGSVEEFLANLGLVARVISVNSSNLGRVTQLVQKTNQFNLTTIRRSRGEIELLLATSGGYSQVVYIEDRYGSYGLTGVLFAVPRADCLFIDTWIMSCRIMGKTVEYAMFECLLEHARANNWAFLEGMFRPTERNAMVASLYPELGFTLVRESPEGIVYRFRTDQEPARTNRLVRIVDGGGRAPGSAE